MSPRRTVLVVALMLVQTVGCSRHRPVSEPDEAPEQKEVRDKPGPPSHPVPGTARAVTGPVTRWINELTGNGWEQKPAERVVRLNEEWWRQLHEVDPKLVDLQIALLQKLPRIDELSSFLERCPETAGLLVSAPDPVSVTKLLDDRDYPLLSGLFVRHAAPPDVAELARVLTAHQPLIVRLHQQGLLGAEMLFLDRPRKNRTRTYEDWLTRELEKRLTLKDERRDEAMASFFHFVLDAGPRLRDQLAEDERFRRAFPDLWYKLSRVVAREEEALEHFLEQPGLWNTLALEEGESLLRQWGPVAIQLLFGSHAYEQDLHPQVIDAMLSGDNNAVHALLKFHNEPLFLDLLRRGLPTPTRIACMQHLLRKEDPRTELRKLKGMSNDGIARHVGPPADGPKTWLPLYSTYVVYEKWQDGREISGLDWVMAVADPASFLLPSGKVATTSVSQAGKRLTVKQAQKALQQQATALARKTLAKQAALQMEKATARQTIHWGTSHLLAEMQRELRRLAVRLDRAASIDITRPVQFVFKRSGMDRETFKRLTGLEARLIMRNDARVRVMLLRKENVAALGPVARTIQRFQEKTSGQEETAGPGERSAKTTTSGLTEKGESASQEQWQKNVSAWWLLHASGLWKHLEDKPAERRP